MISLLLVFDVVIMKIDKLDHVHSVMFTVCLHKSLRGYTNICFSQQCEDNRIVAPLCHSQSQLVAVNDGFHKWF